MTSSKKSFDLFKNNWKHLISYLLHSQQVVMNRKVKYNLICRA